MTKKIAIYPGTFDPVTNGHLDLVARAEQIFDEVIIAVSDNPRKNPLFSTQERIALVDEATKNIPHVRVESFDDLLVNFVARKNAKFVIRGFKMEDHQHLQQYLFVEALLEAVVVVVVVVVVV